MNLLKKRKKINIPKKSINWNSIKIKMILFLGSMLFAISIGTGFMSYQISSRALINNLEQMLPELAKESALILENNIAAGFERLDTIAYNLKNIEAAGDEEISKLKIWKVKGNYLLLGMADTNGVLLTSDNKKINIGDMAIYQKALEGKPAVSEPLPDTFGISGLTEGSLVVAYAHPIKVGSKIERVLVGVKSGNEFSTLVNDISFGKTGRAYMINEKGDIIAHNNLSLVYDKVNYIEEASKDKSFEQLAEMFTLMKNGETGAGEYTYYGKKHFAGYAPVGSTGWSIAVAGERSDLLSGLDKLKQNSITNTIIFMLLGVTGVFLITNSITNGLIVIAGSIRNIANGDLSKELPKQYCMKKDEIGILADSLSKMQGFLRQIIEDIKTSSSEIDDCSDNLSKVTDTVSDATNQVTASIQDIAKGAGEQAEEFMRMMEGLNHFSEELGNMVDLIAGIDQNAINIGDLTEASNSKMQFMVSSSRKINETFLSFIDKITALSENIQKVNEIANYINEIAGQTNLLSLNAAIEAARAGEAGKGFAVVAEHIRTLADQTKNLSVHINTIIQGVSEETGNIIVSTKSLNKDLDQQIAVLDTTMKSFETMIQAIQNIAPEIREVNASAQEIDREKNRIIGKMEGVAAIAQQTCASTEEIAASAQEMSASMDEITNAAKVLATTTKSMQKRVDHFKLD